MPSPKFISLALAGIACALLPIRAQDAPKASLPPVMREVSPGIYEIGKIHLDQNARTVRFPAVLNMDNGILEYLLVTEKGSTHESLFVSDIQPSDLHFVMLLLGAKGAGGGKPVTGEVPPGQIDAKFLKTAPKLAGDSIAITVQWKAADGQKSVPVEDWIYNNETKKPMIQGPWTYNGSMFNDGQFLAQVEGAFAALVTYPSALINNPRPGSDNDAIWTVHDKAIPPIKTPVELTIQLLPAAAAKPTP